MDVETVLIVDMILWQRQGFARSCFSSSRSHSLLIGTTGCIRNDSLQKEGIQIVGRVVSISEAYDVQEESVNVCELYECSFGLRFVLGSASPREFKEDFAFEEHVGYGKRQVNSRISDSVRKALVMQMINLKNVISM